VPASAQATWSRLPARVRRHHVERSFGTGALFLPSQAQREVAAQHFLFFRDSGIIEPMARRKRSSALRAARRCHSARWDFGRCSRAAPASLRAARFALFGAARLISSARSRLVKIGPWVGAEFAFRLVENPRADDVRRQQVDGERTRLKRRSMARARALTSSVLASPACLAGADAAGEERDQQPFRPPRPAQPRPGRRARAPQQHKGRKNRNHRERGIQS